MSTFADLDPSTGETIAEIPISTPDDVRAAVARARAAQPAWQALGVDERCARLARVAEALGARAEEVGATLSREMGKPLRSAIGEAGGYAKHMSSELEEVRVALAPETIPGETHDTRVVREPHGVVAAITPWNFPVGMPLSILVPALATGNSVVFKPSEHVPLTGALLAELLRAELPEGVLELVQGPGETGAALVEADVDMIGFVGSRATGKHIMRAASDGLKRLVLELGGKDPMLVFADADLDAAADCAVQHSLRNTGQVCCSVERVFVAEAVAEEFERRVLERSAAWTFGDPRDEGVKMGPMVSREQRDKVEAQVRDAEARGARLLAGGHLPEGPGAFYPATVIFDAPEDARLSREETFGPVVAVNTFSGDEADGVRLANDTPYGLGANVWTRDPERAERVALGLRAGQVGVNRYLGGAPGTPWVGARQSGFGFLGGVEGHRQFTTPKTIAVAKETSA